MTTALQVAQKLLAQSRFWSHDKLPFRVSLEKGAPKQILVAGENGSGKSLWVESLLSWGRHHHKIAPVEVSIRQRVGGGTAEFGALARAFMFGNETEKSTGATSVQVLVGAFGTVKSRADSGQSALLVLDEPELGLSPGYSAAMGTYLGQLAKEMPELAAGLVIVTHCRALASAFAEELGTVPTFVKLGEPASWSEWVKGEPQRSVKELLALPDAGTRAWRAVEKIRTELRADQKKAKP